MVRKSRSRISIVVLTIIAMCGSYVRSQTPKNSEVTAQQIEQLKAQGERLEKAREENERLQIELLEKKLASMRNIQQALKLQPDAGHSLAALAAIIELNDAQLKLKRALVNARQALNGARVVAADGQYLGKVGPAYDQESITCTWGDYGASYSNTSIWCSYGKYGAAYEVLSPFCAYSTKPPRLMIGGKVVGFVSIGSLASGPTISPGPSEEVVHVGRGPVEADRSGLKSGCDKIQVI